jgi:hypothetical protein
MKRPSMDASDLADEERQKYRRLNDWLNTALDTLKQVPLPLKDFFTEYQVGNQTCSPKQACSSADIPSTTGTLSA